MNQAKAIPKNTNTKKQHLNWYVLLNSTMGALVILVSMVVMLGWSIKSVALVQITPYWSAMQFNTALCFLLCGNCVLLLTNRPHASNKFLQVLAGLVLLLSGLTLVQHFGHVDLNIDELFTDPFTDFNTSHSGRMSMNTAICFFLCASSILTLSSRHYSKLLSKLILVSLGAVLALAFTGLWAYLLNFEKVIGWTFFSGMALHTTIGFLMLSVSLVSNAVKLSPLKTPWIKLYWAEIAAASACLFMSTLLWQTVQSSEHLRTENYLKDKLKLIKTELDEKLTNRSQALERMEHRWEFRNGTPYELWLNDAGWFIKHQNDHQAIEWVDSNLRVRWVVPLVGNESVVGINSCAKADRCKVLKKAIKDNKPVATPTVDLIQGGKGLIIYAPLHLVNGNFDGFIVGVYKLDRLLSNLDQAQGNLFDITIYENNNPIYESSSSNQEISNQPLFKQYDSYSQTSPFQWHELDWSIRITPKPQLFTYHQTIIPLVTLIISLMGTFLIVSLIYFFRKNNRNARHIQSIMHQNELILNSAGEGIFGMDSEGRITFANQAALDLLDFEPHDLNGNNYHEQMHHHHADGTVYNQEESPIYQTLKHGSTHSRDSEVFWKKDGTALQIEYTSRPLWENDAIVGAVVTFKDITERRLKENELMEAKLKAEQGAQAKSDFLATMSHEIRTPMNAVIGMIQLLEHTSLTEQQKNYLKQMRTGGNTLVTVINDILDFSKIEAGHLELEYLPISVDPFIYGVLDLLKTGAFNQKTIELSYAVDENVPTVVMGDETRLRQILLNLVNNALKFTESGSIHLQVGLCQDNDRLSKPLQDNQVALYIQVKDTGIGIPADKIDSLFQAFTQAETSTNRRFGGTGLGLAISQRLIEAMGGQIWVESTLGEGSNFQFTLCTEVSVEESAPTEADIINTTEQEGSLLIVTSSQEQGEELKAACLAQAESLHLEPICTIYPGEALTYFLAGKRFKAAVVSSDLASMSGIELAEAIHEQYAAQACPILLLSGDNPTEATESPLVKGCIKAQADANDIINAVSGILWTDQYESQATIKLKPASKAETNKKLAPSPAAQTETLSQDWPLNILVVEDNAMNQAVIESMMGLLGYEIDIVNNGQEAVSYIENGHYDVVFMDVQMPVMDGMEATRLVKSNQSLKYTPVIVGLSANVLQDAKDSYREVGMNDFISKPVSINELKLIVLYWAQQLQKMPASDTNPGNSIPGLWGDFSMVQTDNPVAMN